MPWRAKSCLPWYSSRSIGRRGTLFDVHNWRFTKPPARSTPLHMPLPAKTTFVTFDVYGTLIDWETGIWDAFAAEAQRDGFTIERDEAHPALPRDPAADRGVAPTSSTPRCCAARRSRSPSGLAGRSSRRGRASCPTRSSTGCLSRRQSRAAREACEEVQARPDLQHRRQAARPDPPPHSDRLRPRRHRAAGALLQAGHRRTSTSARGESAARRVGCTSRPAITTTSSRA